MDAATLDLRKDSLYRQLHLVESRDATAIHVRGRRLADFSSNNYLGLAQNPQVLQAAQKATQKWGAGSGASRLISGNLKIHEELDKTLAQFKKEAAALSFSSGYLANLGILSSFLGEKDVVILDRFCHASLVDAARLSKAKLWVYPHKDLARLAEILKRAQEFEKRLVVTDSYFSMDGDVAPLDELLELCKKHRAHLMIDEAHAVGVYGKSGAGLSEHYGLQGKIDIVMGTLSKSLGSAGGYIAGSEELRNFLINKARTFIYTTAPTPAASAAAIKAIGIIRTKQNLRAKLWANVDFLRNSLESEGADLIGSEGPIIPIQIGDTGKVLRIQKALEHEGFFVPAIRPPTVSKGGDRLRISLSASHQKSELADFIQAFKKIRRKY